MMLVLSGVGAEVIDLLAYSRDEERSKTQVSPLFLPSPSLRSSFKEAWPTFYRLKYLPLKDCFPLFEEHKWKGFLYHVSCGEELRFREREWCGDMCPLTREQMCLLVNLALLYYTVELKCGFKSSQVRSSQGRAWHMASPMWVMTLRTEPVVSGQAAFGVCPCSR